MTPAPPQRLHVGAAEGQYALTPDALLMRLAAPWIGAHPALVVFEADVAQPLQLARALRQAGIDAHYLFVRAPADLYPLRRDLQRAPLIGRRWTLIAASDPQRATIEADALRDAARRARLRTTLDRANASLAAPREGHEAGRAQRMAGHFLSNFLAQSNDALLGVDLDLLLLYWNDSATQLFGIDGASARASLRTLPFYGERIETLLGEVRGGAGRAQAELECVLRARPAWLEVHGSAVRDGAGLLVGFMLSCRDVSERHERLAHERAQQQAAVRLADEGRRQLAALFDQAPGFMAVTRGARHVFEMTNRAYAALFGPREYNARTLDDVFPDLRNQPFARLRDEVYASGRPYVGRAMPVVLQGAKGRRVRYIDFIYQPLRGESGEITGIFCQGHDVTEQKLMQDGLLHHQAELEDMVASRTEALHAANLALQQSQKLEAVGKLTGGVAHDFNNILQIIGSNLDLLGLELGPGAAAQRRVDGARGAVERGGKLAAQLLAFARRQPLQPVATDLTGILRDMDDLLRRALGPAIDIALRIAPDLWNTSVDRDQLENVLLNLAINARDALRGSGRLTIELENATLDSRYRDANPDCAPGEYVLLAVSDDGPGMPPEVRERAFEPFFTTKPEGEGTGLGLSMAYGFVKQSGGHIKIYSEVGHGTTVKIFLPRTREMPVAPGRPRSDAIRGGTETVVVVEDDAAVQRAVIDMLGGLGYTVLAAPDAASALTVLESGVAVDLLFTDVVMPGLLSSSELARLARVLHPGVAVLFTSGYTRNAMMHGARLDPDVELLSKPYRRDELARKVRQMLDARVRAAPSLPAAHPEPETPAAPRVVVVEDNEDGREMLCALVEMLGYAVTGFPSAEAALPALAPGDILMTDLHLPGMSGTALARAARERLPALAVIIASGQSVAPDPALPAQTLLKPFTLEALRGALERALAP
ncbi:ATP-binding protein [Massilia sp. CMS3.1]|uniref:ATP-binding protein n=1 Tax=Massilia sp. CMS3.1 TaxID=3373083 RepID=UPI003EE659A3